jgi:hypothetical protein
MQAKPGVGENCMETCIDFDQFTSKRKETFFAVDRNVDDFERQIASFEKQAREKSLSAIQDMQDVKLPGWLNRLLENRIIPALRRIGFDEQLAWALFKMAAPAWKLMGPITDENIWFHPVLIKDIKEIRRGVLSDARKNSKRLSLLAGVNHQKLLLSTKKSMNPENLSELLEDISLPWIILPRVYDHLEVHHAQYLLGYLKYIDNETNFEFWKILARVIIEFVGNYTLKYISKIQPKDRMIDAIFYGYAAMFWRNLRSPPSGFEDTKIFERYLHCAKMIRNRFAFINCDIAVTVKSMEDMKEIAFPAMNAFGLTGDSHNDISVFLVTLRHGNPGVEVVMKYFGVGGALLKNTTAGCLPYVAVPSVLRALFQGIKKNDSTETSKTQKFIRKFLSKLRDSYDLKRINSIFSGCELPEQLSFVGPRVSGMIQDLTDSLHYGALVPTGFFSE